ncbi:DDE_3 domain-containing protein [Trichonephila clavipes]|nr:DDE_3 domain-containing protein [Trichonephila clavipes]
MTDWNYTRAWLLIHCLGVFFSRHCLRSLLRVPTSHNAIRCVELLGDHLHPFMLFCYPHDNRVFQQDNCTSHNFRLATGRLIEHSADSSVINWPPRSPDNSYCASSGYLGTMRERPLHSNRRTLLNYGQF